MKGKPILLKYGIMVNKMKTLIVDRFEGQYTVCEDKEQKFFAIDTSEMPSDATPGTVICINDDGVITVDAEETERRKKRIVGKQNKLYED